VYLIYEDKINEARDTAEENGPAQNAFDPQADRTVLSVGDTVVLSLLGDKTDKTVGFGTQAETENGLSPFDIGLVHNRLEPA